MVKKFNSKFIIGKNLFIGYSPERIDPGNEFKYKMIPKIVSGYTENCLKVTEKFYSIFFQTVPVRNLETAEITKLYENIYRSVNIGLVNEMKTIADKLKINIFDVIEAAKTKPYGFNASIRSRIGWTLRTYRSLLSILESKINKYEHKIHRVGC